MIHDIPKPEISPNFTVDDIHKIRVWHSEILKDATPAESREFYKQAASETRRAVEELRRRKQQSA